MKTTLTQLLAHPSVRRAIIRARLQMVPANVRRAIRIALHAVPASAWATRISASQPAAAKAQLPQDQCAARRAKHDPKFRRLWLARQAREIARLRTVPLRTITEISVAVNSRTIRQGQLRSINSLRLTAGAPTISAEIPAITAGVIIQLALRDSALASKYGASIDIRGKDATLAGCRGKSHGNHIESSTDWSRGRPQHVRATHDNYVRSIALVMSPCELAYALHETEISIVLPSSYRWEADANGVRAVRADSPRDDYHPSAAELVAPDAAAKIVARLEANRATRLVTASQAAAEAAQIAGVWICLADSVRAGNCRQGSESFATRHGLDARRHYTAPEILAQANGDVGRVRLAITAARIRHEREMSQGFSVLSEHQIGGAA